MTQTTCPKCGYFGESMADAPGFCARCGTLVAVMDTPRDAAPRIDYAKLTRMTRWMYATGWAAANAAQRPALDAAGGAR